MKKNILVAYATRMGSTKAVAEAVADELTQLNNIVELKKIDEITDLSGFDAVVVGSPIQYDQWLPETKSFVREFYGQLKRTPIACFFTCLTLSSDSDKARQVADKYANVIAGLHPQILDVGAFAGVLNYALFSPGFRWIARILFFFLGVREGDYRDWNLVRAWAGKFDQLLQSHQPSITQAGQ